MVGIGVGLIVRQGGSSGGDDALALTISKGDALAPFQILSVYGFCWYLDCLCLTFLLNESFFPVITVMVSSLLIDFVQNFNLDETSVPASE